MTSQNPTNALQPTLEASAESDLVPTFMRLLRMLMIRKKTILTALYLSAICGVIHYTTATRLYESTAKILIDEQNHDQVTTLGDQSGVSNIMDTHSDLLASPVVVKQAIKYLAPEHRIDIHELPPRVWVRRIVARLRTRVPRKKNFIEVTYRSKDPEAAAAVVRAVIRAYLDFVEKHHKGSASEIMAILDNERVQTEVLLKNKQRQLQEFRKEVGHLAASTEDGSVDPMIQRVMRLNDTLLSAQERRLSAQANQVSAEAAYSRGEDLNQHLINLEATLGKQVLLSSMGMSPQDLQAISAQQKKLLATKQEAQGLRLHYGPNHPRILELQQEVQSLTQYLDNYHAGAGQRLDAMGKAIPRDVIVKLLRQTTQQAYEKEAQVQKSFDLARDEATAHSNSLMQLKAMEREVARQETKRDMLTDKIANIDIRQIQAPIQATVVSEPLPNRSPKTPQLRFVAIVSLLGGTLLGVCIAYAQDVLADRFNSPEEMAIQLGVPILAMVRKLDLIPGESLDTIHTHARPNAPETEAFRTLRTVLSLNEQSCDRILISSSEPGDGKTTVSANLAVALAQAGNRTLVIDADLRRPGFTALMNLKGQPGVADVLTSSEPPSISAPPLIHKTAVEGLDVLPVGLRRPNPAELLSSKTFVELLAWVDSKYDRVIVDCPPVLAVSDAQIVGQLVDGAILVVRPEKNHRRSVMRAVESFQATGCHVFGVVANGLSNESAGYGYGYGYGYGHDDETTTHIPQTTEPPRVPSMRAASPPSNQTLPLPTITPVKTNSPPTTIRPRRAA